MSDHDQPPRSSLTAEDLELLATADEELKKRTSKFSFDIDRFTSRIWTGERWQQLLQAHLYYDHVITQSFIEALPKPDALNVSRMSSQKLQFISALGLLPAPLVSPIEGVNNLRNKIAHDLFFELSDQSIIDFINCVPRHLRDAIKLEDGRWPARFNAILRECF